MAALALNVGTASADTTGDSQRHDCPGFASPNFGERYGIFLSTSQIVEPTPGKDVGIQVQHSKTFQKPFRVTGTMTWKNEATGKSGSTPIDTSVERRQIFQPAVSIAAAASVQPGPGTLVVTARVKPGNAPEATCTGRFQIR